MYLTCSHPFPGALTPSVSRVRYHADKSVQFVFLGIFVYLQGVHRPVHVDVQNQLCTQFFVQATGGN